MGVPRTFDRHCSFLAHLRNSSSARQHCVRDKTQGKSHLSANLAKTKSVGKLGLCIPPIILYGVAPGHGKVPLASHGIPFKREVNVLTCYLKGCKITSPVTYTWHAHHSLLVSFVYHRRRLAVTNTDSVGL